MVDTPSRPSAFSARWQHFFGLSTRRANGWGHQFRRMAYKLWSLRSAAFATLMLLAATIAFWFSQRGHDDTLAIYQNRMVGVCLDVCIA